MDPSQVLRGEAATPSSSPLDAPPRLAQPFPSDDVHTFTASTKHRRARFELHDNTEDGISLPPSPTLDFTSRLDMIILDALRWVNTTTTTGTAPDPTAEQWSSPAPAAATPAPRALPLASGSHTPVPSESSIAAAAAGDDPLGSSFSYAEAAVAESDEDAVEMLQRRLHTPEQRRMPPSRVNAYRENEEGEGTVVTIRRTDTRQQQQQTSTSAERHAHSTTGPAGLVSTAQRSPVMDVSAVSPPPHEEQQQSTSRSRSGRTSVPTLTSVPRHPPWQQRFADYAARMLQETQKQVAVLRDYQHAAAREARRAVQLSDALRIAEGKAATVEQTRLAAEQEHQSTVKALSQEVLQLEEVVGTLRRAHVDLKAQLAAALRTELEAHDAKIREGERIRRLEDEVHAVRRELHERKEAWRRERATLLVQQSTRATPVNVSLSEQSARPSPAPLQISVVRSRVDSATTMEASDTRSPPATNVAETKDHTHNIEKEEMDRGGVGDGYLRLHPDVVAQQQLREHTLLSQLSLLEAQLQREVSQRRLAEQRVMDLTFENENLREAAAMVGGGGGGRSLSQQTDPINVSPVTTHDAEAEHQRQQQQQQQSVSQWSAVAARLRIILDFADVKDSENAETSALAPQHIPTADAEFVLRALQALHTRLAEQRHNDAVTSAQDRETVRLTTLQHALQQSEAQNIAHRAALDVVEAQLQDAHTELARWQQRQEELQQRQQQQQNAWKAAEGEAARLWAAMRRALRIYKWTSLPPSTSHDPEPLRSADQRKSLKGLKRKTAMTVSLPLRRNTKISNGSGSGGDGEGPAAAATDFEAVVAGLAQTFQELLEAWRSRHHTLTRRQLQWRQRAREAALSAAVVEAKSQAQQQRLREQMRKLRATEQQHLQDLADLQLEWTAVREEHRLKSLEERSRLQAEARRECDLLRRREQLAEEGAQAAKGALAQAREECRVLQATITQLHDEQAEAAQAGEDLRRRQSDLHVHIEDLEGRLQVSQRTETGLHALLTAATRALVGLLFRLHHLRQTYRVAQALQRDESSLVCTVGWALSMTAADAVSVGALSDSTTEARGASSRETLPLPLSPLSRLQQPLDKSRWRVAVHAVVTFLRLQRLARLRRAALGARGIDTTTSNANVGAPRYVSLSTVLAACHLSTRGSVPGAARTDAALFMESLLPVLRLPPAHELVAPLLSTVQRVAAGGTQRTVHFDDDGSTGGGVSPAASNPLLEHLFAMTRLDVQAPTTHLLCSAATTNGERPILYCYRQQARLRHAALQQVASSAPPGTASASLQDPLSLLPPQLAVPLQHLHVTTALHRRQLMEVKAVVQQLVAQNHRLVSAVETQAQREETRVLELESLSAQLALQQPRNDAVVSLRERLVQSGAALLEERKLRRAAEAQLAELRQQHTQWIGEEQQLRREVYALNMELSNLPTTQASVLTIQQEESFGAAAVVTPSRSPPDRLSARPSKAHSRSAGDEDSTYYRRLLRSTSASRATLRYEERHNIPTAAKVLAHPPHGMPGGDGSGSAAAAAAVSLYKPKVMQQQQHQQQQGSSASQHIDRRVHEDAGRTVPDVAAAAAPASHTQIVIAPSEKQHSPRHSSAHVQEAVVKDAAASLQGPPSTHPQQQQQRHQVCNAGSPVSPSSLQLHPAKQTLALPLAEAWAPYVSAHEESERQRNAAAQYGAAGRTAASPDTPKRSMTLPPPPPPRVPSETPRVRLSARGVRGGKEESGAPIEVASWPTYYT